MWVNVATFLHLINIICISYCLFLDSVLIQKMHNGAPYRITVKTPLWYSEISINDREKS